MSCVHCLSKLGLLIVVALSVVPVARAYVGLVVDQKSVPVGGVITGIGWGTGWTPVFLVPIAVAPRPYACGRNAICRPQSRARPGPPFYFLLDSFRATLDADQRFRFRVPRVKRGAYKVVVWCRPCGGSLILAGRTLEGPNRSHPVKRQAGDSPLRFGE